MKFISVNVELPDTNRDVVITDMYDWYKGYYSTTSNRWYVYHDEISASSVTHWADVNIPTVDLNAKE